MDDERSFGRWLQQRRQALDLTQEALAALVGCAVTTIAKIEAGTRRPSKQIAALLAEHLHIPPAQQAAFLLQARGLSPALFPPHPPALRPAPLPTPTTSFVGREHELAQLTALVGTEDVRLVTLRGPGGVGKTRLALQAAARLLPHFADGVAFVSLAAIRDPTLLPTAIMHALGIVPTAEHPRIAQITATLRERTVLLVLDNVEQIVTAVPLITELLSAAPALKVLVTSRTVLHLPGEYEFLVPPLALPDLAALPSTPDLAQIASVDLFVRRMQAITPSFVLTEAHAPLIAAICVRLDGLPLALELAAARTRLFALPTLLARLEQRLLWLTSQMREVPLRHQTLRNTLAWSYDLLAPAEQVLFARLGVFAGGWTVAAAEAVCQLPVMQAQADSPASGASASRVSAPTVLDGLESLLTQSMIMLLEQTETLRFGMLETIREYALEQLAERDEMHAMCASHATYYCGLAEAAEPALIGADQATWLSLLEREQANLRSALEWAVQADPPLAARISVALWRFWDMRGDLSEGRAWLARVGQHLDQVLLGGRSADEQRICQLWRARVSHAAGHLAISQSDYAQARAHYEAAALLFAQQDDTVDVQRARCNLGLVAWFQGEYVTAQHYLEESLGFFQTTGDRWRSAMVLRTLGVIAISQCAYAAASDLLNASLTLFQELGDQRGIASAIGNLGLVSLRQGDHAQATSYGMESLTRYRQLEDKVNIAIQLWQLGVLACQEQQYQQARRYCAEAIQIAQITGQRDILALCLEEVAQIAQATGSLQRAVRLVSAAAHLREQIGLPLTPDEQLAQTHVLQTARAQLSETTFQLIWDIGQQLSPIQAIADALMEEKDDA